MSPDLRAWLPTGIAAAGDVTAWVDDGAFAAAASTEPDALRPLLARRGALLAAGDVRLDNRGEVAGWGGVRGDRAPDIELVLAAYAARGAGCLDALLGDFALVLWDGDRRTLTAIRDPFGVKALFVTRRGGALLLASRADALARGGDLDEEWIADFLVGGAVSPVRTVWTGVEAVAPGEVLAWRDGSISRRRFWSAADFAPTETADERAATETFRGLLEEAVRVRTEGGVPVWSQLSGGLDSSSVVCVAQTLAESGRGPGVAGTVTLVETLGDGDERKYSDAVVRRWGLRNETVIDPWAWQDDGSPPPRTDEPRPHYPFWARDREMVARVRGAGGRVLLSGQGSDHYLAGSLGFITDLIAAGHMRTAMRELVRFSVAARQSFWTGLGRHGIHPFLPTWLQARRARADEQLPEWLDAGFGRRMEIGRRLPAVRQLAVPRGGSFFAHQIATELALLPAFVERGPFQDGIEMRYPFLHRPLVEHSLRLPPPLRIRPRGGKHVLREAMRGILPEEIRTRRGKGGIDARLLWALHRERARLEALLRDPEIARRGWVRADALRAATGQARQGEVRSLPLLLCSLALETWLAVRAGRWEALVRAPAAVAA
ncbi:asparagine synthetase B family protein [Longimicrobium sp.]|uniref:asparagine synthetase B family protein n=1 Tax=Longimicrobium sp. TaxID=2029185 RepID=UPI002BDF9B3B|nr:asparagine synthase-related protein [Longimicrobium sp.]HSU15793.1 asparagine synthase-related protein [Longimicrobium sp.]